MDVSELTDRLRRRLDEAAPILHFHERWFTGGEFLSDIGDVHALLRKMRVKVGDRVLLAESNTYAFAATYIAILLYGATVIPVNPAMPMPELDKVAARSNAVGAFVHFGILRYFLERQSETTDSVRFVATLAGVGSMSCVGRLYYLENAHWQQQDLAELDADRAIARREVLTDRTRLAEDTPAIMLFTSGTTGTPKGVELTHRHVMATVRNIISAHELGPDDISYCFLPMFHINAQVIAFLSTFASGGRIVLETKFSASRFWQTVDRHGVTWVSAVPAVIAILIKSPGELPDGHRLRFMRSASAPLPELHARRFEARFGIPVIESYGMTEAASQICANPLPPRARKFGSVGVPQGVLLRVVGERGEALPVNAQGEIAICGESVIDRYAYGDDRNSSFIDGWFRTGDIGYVDGDGYVFLTGRSKEMINRAGQKISPREVEEVIDQHPDVRGVAVIGVPDDVYGERVVAYVVADCETFAERSLSEQLKDLCRGSISDYKCPSEIFMVSELPVGPTGKIQRLRLKQQVLALDSAR